jgi:hypothetical protein
MEIIEGKTSYATEHNGTNENCRTTKMDIDHLVKNFYHLMYFTKRCNINPKNNHQARNAIRDNMLKNSRSFLLNVSNKIT